MSLPHPVLPYAWLSLAIASCWLPQLKSDEAWPSRIVVSAAWWLLAVSHGYATGIVSPVGVLVIVAFGLLCYRHSRTQDAVTTIVTVLFALALMAHVVPGFSNLLVVRDAVLSAGAVPYTLFLNFDKAQIGLFLLAFGPPLLSPRSDWVTMLRGALPHLLVLIAVLMMCALLLGQVALDFKWPAIFPVWAWSNLFFTCTAEEALFRGVIQRRLQGEPSSPAQTSAKSLVGRVRFRVAAVLDS